MTSHFEGIPAALIEAMTCGMPVVSTDCGVGVRALIDGYSGAALVTRGDTVAFASAITALSPGEAPAPFDAESYTIEAGAVAYVEAFQQVRRRAPSGSAILPQIEIGDVALERRMVPRSGRPPSHRGRAI